MASRLRQLALGLALALTFGCNDDGGGGNSGSDGFDSFNDDFGGGGGGLAGCLQYAQACETDPYCFCFASCVFESETTEGCLERCNLAQVPYWAEQFLVCAEAALGVVEIPGQPGLD